eukprot:3658085-Amphidinium_carterae.1
MDRKRTKKSREDVSVESLAGLVKKYAGVNRSLCSAELREASRLSEAGILYLEQAAADFLERHSEDGILFQYSQDSTPVMVRKRVSKKGGQLKVRKSGKVTEHVVVQQIFLT